FFKQKPKEPSIANAHFVLDKVDQWVQLSPHEKIGLFLLDPTNEEKLSKDSLLIEEKNLHLPLTIRHRQPGDRMRYAGLKGSKKSDDMCIDQKAHTKQSIQAWLVQDSLVRIL